MGFREGVAMVPKTLTHKSGVGIVGITHYQRTHLPHNMGSTLSMVNHT